MKNQNNNFIFREVYLSDMTAVVKMYRERKLQEKAVALELGNNLLAKGAADVDVDFGIPLAIALQASTIVGFANVVPMAGNQTAIITCFNDEAATATFEKNLLLFAESVYQRIFGNAEQAKNISNKTDRLVDWIRLWR